MPGSRVSTAERPAPEPKNQGTHEGGGNSFGIVYANNLARQLMKAGTPLQFPRGSIIVREKLLKADDSQPELLTVMIKRERGFNRAANDWEFLLVDGAASKIFERQKKGSCLDCHVSQKQRDFVYPTPAVVNK
jgi:hypothetical protein